MRGLTNILLAVFVLAPLAVICAGLTMIAPKQGWEQ